MIQPMMCAAAMMFGGLVGASAPATPPGTLPAAAITQAADQKIIVHIVSRNETVTVKSGPKGLLYSVTGTDGHVAIADATPDKLAELRPDLFKQLRQYIAVEADASDATDAPLPEISARLD